MENNNGLNTWTLMNSNLHTNLFTFSLRRLHRSRCILIPWWQSRSTPKLDLYYRHLVSVLMCVYARTENVSRAFFAQPTVWLTFFLSWMSSSVLRNHVWFVRTKYLLRQSVAIVNFCRSVCLPLYYSSCSYYAVLTSQSVCNLVSTLRVVRTSQVCGGAVEIAVNICRFTYKQTLELIIKLSI